LQEHINRKCEEALTSQGFDSSGTLLETTTFKPNQPQHIEQAAIENAAICLNIWEYNASDYELPHEAVNISIENQAALVSIIIITVWQMKIIRNQLFASLLMVFHC
jgi:hypothetical protein